MSDDDDFGLDDDIFDAADLAKIDEIEHKYAAASQASSSQTPSKPPTNNVPNVPTKPSQDRFIRPLPPAKRLRTNEWNVTSLPNRDYTVQEEEDDTPNYAVVAAKDGKYRILNSSDPPPRASSLAVPSVSGSSTGSQQIRMGGQHVRPVASQRQDGSNNSQYPRGGRGTGTQNSAVPPRNVGSSQSRFAAITAALKETRLSENEGEMEALRAQVAELKRANEAATAALRTAHEEKLTKEGEISTIRRTIANLKDSHAQTVAKVQAEKLAAEEKRKQIERQMKQEMERLQTNLALRRQEIETSTRKTPWSARKQRVALGPTPGGPSTSHFRPLALANETPSRPARLRIPDTHGNGNANANTASKKDKGKNKGPAFPTFVDSFQNTSPVKTPSRTQSQRDGGRSGGGRSAGAKEVPDMETMFPPILNLEEAPTPTARSAPTRSRAVSFGRKSASARSATEEESGPDWAESFDSGPLILEFDGRSGQTLEEEAEVQNEMIEGDIEEEEEGPLEAFDLKEQLYRILFAHVSLPLYHLTLQMLLSTQIPEEHREHTSAYVEASSALVEALAPKSLEYGTILQMVVKALLRMGRILCDISSTVALAGIFSLIATMCLFLPRTTSLLLPEEVDETIPPVLSLVVEVIKKHAVPKGSLSAETELLIRECLNFLEALCLTLPKDLITQMRFVVAEPTFVSHLLDGRQPLWILQSTVQSLSTLSTYEDASTVLLVPPRDSRDRKIPLLERLSYMLVETIATVGQKEQHSLQIPILTIFTQLSLSSPDALGMLVQSQALIPALVANLSNYSARAWEDDEDLYDEPALLVLSQIIQGTLRLLHYLVFRGGPQVDLQKKIQYPPPKMNGLEHMFVVGLGRLSYADPPEWQSKVAREALENGAMLASELLENVVDGLEVDAIWTSFQGSEDNSGSETDDEEMEARKVAQDDDMILVD